MDTSTTHVGFQIGAKIRSFRTMRQLTQKQLAESCGLSESAIRNYELGNRYPDEQTLLDIADALEIDRAALRDPNPQDISSVEHFMFALEQLYGIIPKVIDGEIHLLFDKTPDTFSDQEIIYRYMLKDSLYNWCEVRDALLMGEITPEDYQSWKIAHSDIIGTDIRKDTYTFPLDQQIEMETARRALGYPPVPVYDENHVNVMPIPKKKKTSGESALETPPAEELAKSKRKRKPKSNS